VWSTPGFVGLAVRRDEGNAKAFVMSKEGSERGQNEEGSEASPKNSSIQAILRSQCNSVDDRETTSAERVNVPARRTPASRDS
jgi:hypothetical protein